MATIFRNPPLIEMIAELRWNSSQAPQGLPILMPDQARLCEEMFARLTGRVGVLGYEHVERLVPHDFPLLPYEPALRLRPKTGNADTTLYQIGPNLFTANATPPYQSWENFAPRVRDGVHALLESRPDPDIRSPFFASLRYIDAFRDDLTQGQSLAKFLSETLDVRLNINPAITQHCTPGKEISSSIQLVVPIELGTMRIQFAEGRVAQDPALIMDMTVTLTDVIEPDIDALMKAFGDARKITHQVFLGLTSKITSLMQPEGADSA